MTKSVIKYLIKEIPPLDYTKIINQQRLYMFVSSKSVLRAQKTGDIYTVERKSNINAYTNEKQFITISEKEFKTLKTSFTQTIERQIYYYATYPELTIKKYKGTYTGLIRAEITFTTKKALDYRETFPWLGKDITISPLSQDATLLQMDQQAFKALLAKTLLQ